MENMMKKILISLVAASAAMSANAVELEITDVVYTPNQSVVESEEIGDVSVVTAQDIENSGATTLKEVLEMQPNLQIWGNTSADGNFSIGIRGFSETNHQNGLILVDGRELNLPTLEGPDLKSVNLDNIDRIEILNGSAGSRFGDKAVGGVINIITKPSGKARHKIGVAVGTYDTQKLNASSSNTFKNGLSYVVNVSDRSSDNYRDDNESENTNTYGKLQYNHASGMVFIEAQGVQETVKYAGSRPVGGDRRDSDGRGNFLDTDTQMQRVGFKQKVNNNLSIKGDASIQDSDGDGVFFGPYFKDTRSKQYNLEANAKIKNIAVSAGYEGKKSDYQNGFGSNLEQDVNALYVHGKVNITPKLSMSANARKSRVKSENIGRSTQNEEKATVKGAAVSYTINKQQSVYARYDENFRYANLDENNLTLGSALKPQTGESYEAGWQFKNSRASLNVNAYQLDLEDEIYYDAVVANPNSFFGFGANVNLESSKRLGGSITGKLKVNNKLRLGGGYNYVDAEFDSGSFKGKDIPYVAKHLVKLNANYKVTPSVDVNVDSQYTGKRYPAGDNANSSDKLDAYTVTNANVRWKQQGLSVSGRVNNVFNEIYNDYENTFGEYPAPERSVIFSVDYEMK